MTWLFVGVGALLVVAIAWVAVARVVADLGGRPRLSVYDRDEALEFVVERLPEAVTARLSYDDVDVLLGFHLDHLEAKWATLDRLDAGLVDDTDGLAAALGRADEAGVAVSDADVVAVVEAQTAYLEAIGLFGPPIDP